MQLYQGDCLEIMKQIPDKSVDMILCDLPYGTTDCSWDTIIPFDALWERYRRIIKDNGCIALFGSEPFSSLLRTSNLRMYKYDWVWVKSRGANFNNFKYAPQKNFELISIFCKGVCNYNPIMIATYDGAKSPSNRGALVTSSTFKLAQNRKSLYVDDGYRYPLATIYYANGCGELNNPIRLHPTQKPVELLEYLIRTYTNEGDLVLDNCMGSGSTGVAACNTNRNFIGIELDNEYFQIAKDRIEQAQKYLGTEYKKPTPATNKKLF